MISYLRGTVEEKGENYIIIDVGGIGYNVSMPSCDIAQLVSSSQTKIFTYFYVRENQPELYGFLSKDELEYFNNLIQISGVGPKAAISILSALPPNDIALAVISDDVKAITRAQGVGTKIAQRIILEMKNKIKTEDAVVKSGSAISTTTEKMMHPETEAVNALIALGASPSESQKTVMQVYKTGMTTEEIIKESLRRMSNGI